MWRGPEVSPLHQAGEPAAHPLALPQQVRHNLTDPEPRPPEVPRNGELPHARSKPLPRAVICQESVRQQQVTHAHSACCFPFTAGLSSLHWAAQAPRLALYFTF